MIYDLPGCNASAAFITSEMPFREDIRQPVRDIGPYQYIPWGADNLLPYSIIDRFEADETLQSCIDVQAETLYAAGLQYRHVAGSDSNRQGRAAGPTPEQNVQWPAQSAGIALRDPEPRASSINDFLDDNDLSSYFLGVCRDIKMFEFAVSVIILSNDGLSITNVYRLHAAYCRFSPKDYTGHIPYLLSANWRTNPDADSVERIPIIDSRSFMSSLERLRDAGYRKMAIVSRLPGYDSLYYPIPSYGSIFRGHWYNIKNFIAIAKEAKLKNAAPLKYLIEVSRRYWDDLCHAEHVVDPAKKVELINRTKRQMVDFLTGAANSGKAIFSNFSITPDGKVSQDIKITKIDAATEGGDWASDHAEAINMLCFAMRVHSNLVGSVPGKAQSNNSGSDKRELYTIAQAMQKAYRECLLRLHRLIIRYNRWHGVEPVCPIIQLTTLDSHTDAQKSEI